MVKLTKSMIWTFAVIFLIITVVVVNTQTTAFTTTSNDINTLKDGTISNLDKSKVYLAIFSNIVCTQCPSSPVTKNVDTLGSATGTFKDIVIKTYKCDDVRALQGCRLDLSFADNSVREIAVYKCNNAVSQSETEKDIEKEVSFFSSGLFKSNGKCQVTLKTQLTGMTKFFEISNEEYITVATKNQVSTKFYYNAFCTDIIDGKNRRVILDGCDVNNVVSSMANAKDFDYTKFGTSGSVQNVIFGYQAFVDLRNVVDGKFLQLNRMGGSIESCSIKTDDDGNRYVDDSSCSVDTRYVCLPSAPPTGYSCIGGKELVKIEAGAKCVGGLLPGATEERIIGTDNCKLTCSSEGKMIVKSCEAIKRADEGVIATTTSKDNKTDNTLWYVLAIGLVVLTLMIVLYMLQKKKK